MTPKKKKPPAPYEVDIQNEIIREIGSRPDLCIWRNNTGALEDARGVFVHYGLKGTPDLLGFLIPSGRTFGLEVKRDHTVKLRPEQAAFMKMANASGAFVRHVWSVEQAVDALEEALVEQAAFLEWKKANAK